MNRVIKFRGKDLETKDFVFGSLIAYTPCPVIQSPELLENDYDYQSWEVDPETVGQYTGLKDKNVVEIYEGDIVNFHLFTQELSINYGVTEGEREYKGYICFEELGLAFKQSEEDEEWFYLVYSPGVIHEESFEVIGNIHSNPELLK